jgi:preprotein translocase subunit Sec63
VYSRPRAARTLTRPQRQALDRLVALGASLGVDFTIEELRSVFRTLARQYHPDRHPDTDDRERARLSATFATVRDAYDQLKGAA